MIVKQILAMKSGPGEIVTISPDATVGDAARLLSPADLQAIKASGVTFAASMVERVIEEQAAGNPDLAAGIRARIGEAIGANLRGIVPGSDRAAEVARILKAEGLWSQYLEVGIGPDAEIFTKCQPMASVGWGADVGLHPISRWNNPEPEIVLAVDSRGRIRGATLGNDVNLRDVEGRSALREWLAAPTPEHFEMRDVAELKLFFNEAGSPDDVGKLAQEQIRQHEERIADYEDMVARHGREEWAEPRMITIELGLEMEHAALRFWSALANDDLDRLRRERAERDPRD